MSSDADVKGLRGIILRPASGALTVRVRADKIRSVGDNTLNFIRKVVSHKIVDILELFGRSVSGLLKTQTRQKLHAVAIGQTCSPGQSACRKGRR
jgi:hypothetical protein